MRSLFAAASRDTDHDTILAVDASYAVFHRFFAMRRWERMAGVRGPEPDAGPATDEDLQAFGDSFRQTLCAQMRTHGVRPSETVLMIDCSRADIWRREINAEYKATRQTPGDFAPNVFGYFHGVLLPDLVQSLGVHAVSCPRAEADDVAHVLCKWAAARDKRVIVITGDADLAQLAVPGRVRVLDIKGACVLEKACKKAGCCLDGKTYLEIKVLQGDKGDNVLPVRPRMGPKSALRLVNDPAALAKELADDAVRTRYEENRVMVDLSRMPEGIAAEIDARLCELLPDACFSSEV